MITRTKYIPKEIEAKWQTQWEAEQLYHAPDDSPKPKFYHLVMLPYTSGCAGYLGHPFRKLACCARLNRLPCETGEMRVQSTRFILLALVFQRVNLHEGEVHSCCLCSPQSSNESVIIFTCSKNVCCVGSSHQRPRLCSVRSPISLEGNPNCLRKMRCYGNS